MALHVNSETLLLAGTHIIFDSEAPLIPLVAGIAQLSGGDLWKELVSSASWQVVFLILVLLNKLSRDKVARNWSWAPICKHSKVCTAWNFTVICKHSKVYTAWNFTDICKHSKVCTAWNFSHLQAFKSVYYIELHSHLQVFKGVLLGTLQPFASTQRCAAWNFTVICKQSKVCTAWNFSHLQAFKGVYCMELHSPASVYVYDIRYKFNFIFKLWYSQGSGIVSRHVISYGQDYRGQRIPFPAEERISLLRSVQTDPMVHTEPYSMDTRGKASEAWSWHSFAFSIGFNLLQPSRFFTYHHI